MKHALWSSKYASFGASEEEHFLGNIYEGVSNQTRSIHKFNFDYVYFLGMFIIKLWHVNKWREVAIIMHFPHQT